MQEIRYMRVRRVPTIGTISKWAWGHHDFSGMSDQDFLRVWKWTLVAGWLYRNLIMPVGYRHRTHYHILPQAIEQSHVDKVAAEFSRRKLNERWGLDLELPAAMRGKSGEEVNRHLDKCE